MRILRVLTLVAAALLCGCASPDEPPTPAAPGALSMRRPRLVHTQTKLPDGRVLVAGGLEHAKTLLPPANNDVELYDPASRNFTVVARMKTVRGTHTATLLADGRLVFIGGSPGTSVDVFDPKAAGMTPGGDVLEVRAMHTATLLTSGKILLVGGMSEAVTYSGGEFHQEKRYLRTIEVYDPQTRSSRPFGSPLRVPRRGHTATLLADGRVLVVGGTWAARTEIIDPVRETVTWGPVLGLAREDHRTTRLADGRLLVTGGSAPLGQSLDVAEIFEPATNRFRTLQARMHQRREDHTADLLPDGRVLITGGEDNQAGPDGRDIVLDDVEIFDPKTETFTKLPPLSTPRDDHASSDVADGVVLVTGGEDKDDTGLASAELVVVTPERARTP